MTIYKLSDEILYKYKNKYGENVCGANVLDLLGFPKSTIEKLLKYRGEDFEWDDMVNIINEHDSKIKNKIWLIDKAKTTKLVLNYDKRDKQSNKYNIQFIADELQNGTYKIIGIATENWGHYMILGKNSKGDILTYDPQSQTLIIGIDNIIKDFDEDNIEYVISYSNGIVLDIMKQKMGASIRRKKKKRKKTKKKRKKTKKKERKLKKEI
jgi:hypothetical protein